MQHIRKTHHVKRKTALSFAVKAYKDIITIEKTNPTDNDKWELKPHSDENIDISNKHGKIVFQCPLLRCKSKLKHIQSVIDHLNKVHKIPRGEKMQDIVTHAQKTFVESKELTNIHFSKKDKKRLIAIQETLAVKTESKLQKYKEAIKRRQKREEQFSEKIRKREQERKNRDNRLLTIKKTRKREEKIEIIRKYSYVYDDIKPF